jgi:hypothetical protein
MLIQGASDRPEQVEVGLRETPFRFLKIRVPSVLALTPGQESWFDCEQLWWKRSFLSSHRTELDPSTLFLVLEDNDMFLGSDI